MRRVMLCLLSACLLASAAVFSQPAKAGAGDYYRGYHPYRYGYYRPHWYYGHKNYYAARLYGGYGLWRGSGYPYANFVPPPDCRLVRIANLDGTWIWARRAGCF